MKATAEGLFAGEAEISTKPFEGKSLPDGKHALFTGKEEDNVVVKPSSWQKRILEKPRLKIASVQVGSSQDGYPASNIIDNDDHTWWIAGEDRLPQVVTLCWTVRHTWLPAVSFSRKTVLPISIR